MPDNDLIWVIAILAVLSGSGVFLRLVGKEKHRREKYLAARAAAKAREAEEERAALAEQATGARRQTGDIYVANLVTGAGEKNVPLQAHS